jgi:calcium-translocating P-type ATPase
VVGDIVRLNAGDKIPADGILVLGNDITCNESAITGESDDLKKNSHDGDVFLLSGATISSGYGHMLVTAVGVNSRWGRSKAKLVAESAETPLQQKLNVLAEQIGYFGMGAAVATFTALVALWFIYPESRASDITLFKYVLKAFIMGVTIVVVAVPEGLPLAVTLSLAYSTQKMMNDHNLIRVLAACETMGNATTICSDKTGTLTQNRMTVVEEWIGGEHYKKQLTDSKAFSSTFVNHLAVNISANSTAVLIKPVTGTLTVSGSNTEGALLLMLLTQLNKDYEKIRADSFDASRGDRMFTFSSTRKCMSVLILNADGKSGNIYIKGAAEVLINRCTSYSTSSGDEAPLTVAIKQKVLKAVHDMATNALRTVVLAHRSITNVTGSETVEEIEQAGFTLDLLVGIKDPLRPDVIEAVKTCQQAGIFVRMVTGDNIDTAKAIAAECGIYTTGGLAMEGPEFRKLTPAQLDAILPTLQVLARSSPTDKHTLVCRLNGHRLPESKEEWETLHPGENWEEKKNLLLPGYAEEWRASRAEKGGEVVGVTGDGTNDGPALKAADVGLSMGLSGTDGK